MNLRTHLTLRVTERTSGEMTIKSETDKGETFRASGLTAGFVFWGVYPLNVNTAQNMNMQNGIYQIDKQKVARQVSHKFYLLNDCTCGTVLFL